MGSDQADRLDPLSDSPPSILDQAAEMDDEQPSQRQDFFQISKDGDPLGKRANDYDEIQPLIDLCKAGRLFDVQAWIADGKPINPPPRLQKGLEKVSAASFH